MAAELNTTLDTLLECVCAALAEHDRAVCACGLTIGPPVIGWGQCCQCGTETDGPGGQASAFIERMYPADAATLSRVNRIESCRTGGMAADMTVVVTRCYPSLDDQGRVPSVDETRPFAEELNDDLQIVFKALRCCTGLKLLIRDMAVDSDPEAGCSTFAVRVTVEVSPTAPTVPVGS